MHSIHTAHTFGLVPRVVCVVCLFSININDFPFLGLVHEFLNDIEMNVNIMWELANCENRSTQLRVGFEFVKHTFP